MKFKFLDEVKIIEGFYKGQAGVIIRQIQLHSYVISLEDVLIRNKFESFTIEVHEDYIEKI